MSERGVAQPGSAPVLGTGGRRFESCRPDNKKAKKSQIFLAFLLYKTPALDGLEGITEQSIYYIRFNFIES